ncbi:hypothetical protein CICLE_v10007210mg [Citrus x clementina]|uniref:Uncharacterized protein n=1 Tax=Citrus clementina TaxID=85681 RepID=V4U3P7_CITCL|nr:hypothetical protein CICLE_v10007210mg [Citrus x clementina]
MGMSYYGLGFSNSASIFYSKVIGIFSLFQIISALHGFNFSFYPSVFFFFLSFDLCYQWRFLFLFPLCMLQRSI